METINYKKYQNIQWFSNVLKVKSLFFCISECQNYGSLNSYTRKITHITNSYYCDNRIGPGWIRFEGSAGTRLPTSCPPYHRCGSSATGWLNGGHPTIADGQVSRRTCFHDFGNCCFWSTNIKLRNCGSYYVYYLHSTPNNGRCSLRYCSTNWKQIASKVLHNTIKKKGKKKRLQYLNFYYNLSKRRKKTIWHFNTTLIQLNVLLELTSKNSFL